MMNDRHAPGPPVEIGHRTWGAWPSVRLATRAVELEVVSEVGARVVSLRDRHRGREWLVQGEPPAQLEQVAWAEERVVFSGRESFGWDECLPTVSVCPDPLDPGGPPLRDHGDQWGRGAHQSIDHASGAVEHTWSAPRWPYRLWRRLSFADEQTVLAEYEIVSLADEPLPLLYSQHAVIALEAGSYIDLPEVHRALRTVQLGIDLPEQVDWPRTAISEGREVDLACVTPGDGWAAKLYAHAPEAVRAVAPDGARLDFDRDREFAPVLGIWLSHGGWKADGVGYEQVALEPTTSPDDHLAAALEHGRQRMLEPGRRLTWWVTMRLA